MRPFLTLAAGWVVVLKVWNPLTPQQQWDVPEKEVQQRVISLAKVVQPRLSRQKRQTLCTS
jgi:hypothetical protein